MKWLSLNRAGAPDEGLSLCYERWEWELFGIGYLLLSQVQYNRNSPGTFLLLVFRENPTRMLSNRCVFRLTVVERRRSCACYCRKSFSTPWLSSQYPMARYPMAQYPMAQYPMVQYQVVQYQVVQCPMVQ